MATSKKSQNQKKANAKKAAEEYNQIESKPFDIKKLILQVAVAQKVKSAKVSKEKKSKVIGEKQKLEIANAMLVAQQADTTASQVAEDIVVLKKKNIDLKTKKTTERKKAKKATKPQFLVTEKEETATEAVRLLDVTLRVIENYKVITKEEIDFAGKYHRTAQEAVQDLPVGDVRQILFSRLIKLTLRFRAIKVTDLEKIDPDNNSDQKAKPKENVAGKTKEKLLGKANEEKPKWGVLQKALKLAGGVGAEKAGKGRVNGVPLGSANSSTFVAKSTGSVGAGLKAVGMAIKQNGLDTLKWIGKRLSDLTSRVMGFFRSAKNFLTSGSGLEDIIGLAAIGIGVLPALISGMHAQLKKEFGDDYLDKFINSSWTKVKDFIQMKIIDALFAKDQTLDELNAETKTQVDKRALAEKQMAQAPVNNASGDIAYSQYLTDEQAGARRSTEDKAIDTLSGKLLEYDNPATTPARKQEVAQSIQNLFNTEPSLYKNSRVVASVTARGITLNKGNTTNKGATTSTSNIGGSTSVGGSSFGGATSVGFNPMGDTGGSAPVTADRPAPNEPSRGSGDSGATPATPAAGGLTTGMIPTNAAGDTLVFFNIGGLTATA